jgi:hypothetical protein
MKDRIITIVPSAATTVGVLKVGDQPKELTAPPTLAPSTIVSPWSWKLLW